MTEHYTKNTVSVSAWCPKCRKETMHRVDAGRRGPCLECIKKAEAEKKPEPTGSFFCPECQAWTTHRMDAGGWKKGACLSCEDRAVQPKLFA